MKKYRKLIVAVAGLLVAAAGRRYGIESEAYTDIVGLLTAAGVYVAPNE